METSSNRSKHIDTKVFQHVLDFYKDHNCEIIVERLSITMAQRLFLPNRFDFEVYITAFENLSYQLCNDQMDESRNILLDSLIPHFVALVKNSYRGNELSDTDSSYISKMQNFYFDFICVCENIQLNVSKYSNHQRQNMDDKIINTVMETDQIETSIRNFMINSCDLANHYLDIRISLWFDFQQQHAIDDTILKSLLERIVSLEGMTIETRIVDDVLSILKLLNSEDICSSILRMLPISMDGYGRRIDSIILNNGTSLSDRLRDEVRKDLEFCEGLASIITILMHTEVSSLVSPRTRKQLKAVVLPQAAFNVLYLTYLEWLDMVRPVSISNEFMAVFDNATHFVSSSSMMAISPIVRSPLLPELSIFENCTRFLSTHNFAERLILVPISSLRPLSSIYFHASGCTNVLFLFGVKSLQWAFSQQLSSLFYLWNRHVCPLSASPANSIQAFSLDLLDYRINSFAAAASFSSALLQMASTGDALDLEKASSSLFDIVDYSSVKPDLSKTISCHQSAGNATDLQNDIHQTLLEMMHGTMNIDYATCAVLDVVGNMLGYPFFTTYANSVGCAGVSVESIATVLVNDSELFFVFRNIVYGLEICELFSRVRNFVAADVRYRSVMLIANYVRDVLIKLSELNQRNHQIHVIAEQLRSEQAKLLNWAFEYSLEIGRIGAAMSAIRSLESLETTSSLNYIPFFHRIINVSYTDGYFSSLMRSIFEHRGFFTTVTDIMDTLASSLDIANGGAAAVMLEYLMALQIVHNDFKGCARVSLRLADRCEQDLLSTNVCMVLSVSLMSLALLPRTERYIIQRFPQATLCEEVRILHYDDLLFRMTLQLQGASYNTEYMQDFEVILQNLLSSGRLVTAFSVIRQAILLKRKISTVSDDVLRRNIEACFISVGQTSSDGRDKICNREFSLMSSAHTQFEYGKSSGSRIFSLESFSRVSIELLHSLSSVSDTKTGAILDTRLYGSYAVEAPVALTALFRTYALKGEAMSLDLLLAVFERSMPADMILFQVVDCLVSFIHMAPATEKIDSCTSYAFVRLACESAIRLLMLESRNKFIPFVLFDDLIDLCIRWLPKDDSLYSRFERLLTRYFAFTIEVEREA